MGIVNYNRINQILSLSYSRGLLFSSWLEEQGFSDQLLRKYRSSGWLEGLCRGVMYREKLPLQATTALTCFNEQLNKEYRVAALSALELAGFNHYVPMGKPLLMVAHAKGKAPQWFDMDAFNRKFVLFTTDAFSNPLTTKYEIDGFKVLSSVPELAFMECLLLAPSRYRYMDLFYVMEQLTSLRPDVVQEILTTTTNLKVKRMFLYMAEKAGHYWFDMLDTSQINLGTGKMQLVKGGTYIAKYKITIPTELYQYE